MSGIFGFVDKFGLRVKELEEKLTRSEESLENMRKGVERRKEDLARFEAQREHYEAVARQIESGVGTEGERRMMFMELASIEKNARRRKVWWRPEDLEGPKEKPLLVVS